MQSADLLGLHEEENRVFELGLNLEERHFLLHQEKIQKFKEEFTKKGMRMYSPRDLRSSQPDAPLPTVKMSDVRTRFRNLLDQIHHTQLLTLEKEMEVDVCERRNLFRTLKFACKLQHSTKRKKRESEKKESEVRGGLDEELAQRKARIAEEIEKATQDSVTKYRAFCDFLENTGLSEFELISWIDID